MTKSKIIRETLYSLERQLNTLGYWQRPQPEAKAFETEAPFAYDTMDFAHWLQWLFIPQFHALLDAEMPLPKECNIAPMVEEFIKSENITGAALLDMIKTIDQTLTGEASDTDNRDGQNT